MDHINKIYIRRKLESYNLLSFFFCWIKEKHNLSFITNEYSKLDCGILIELANKSKLKVNELRALEVLYKLNFPIQKRGFSLEELTEFEDLKTFLCQYIRNKKKPGNEFYTRLEEDMTKKHLFSMEGKGILDFLLIYILKRYSIRKIDPKYVHCTKWFQNNETCVNWNESNQSTANANPSVSSGTNFIQQIIEEDLKNKKHIEVITRFPPEPNGFLHLGHAKSICLNFGLSQKYGGRTHLRFDDTNPVTEEVRYIDSIKKDVQWLGYDWKDHLYFASDYFEQLYQWAVQLIKQGDAYVDDQTMDEIRKTRGSIKVPGVDSPYRNRSIEENLDLFERMKKGEFKEGERVLRAKIDMSSGNMNMRDPVLYRIMHKTHPNTKDQWVIYPMYDYAHGQSDSIEKITHSICTLEFESHRPLYEWFQEKLGIFRTRQIEFARLNVTYMVMSKRKLLILVNEGWVKDWDDPRMPTISGMRRRGYSPDAIRDFCSRVGIAKRENLIAFELLELCVRENMHDKAKRFNGVVRPLKVTIINFDEKLRESSDFYNLVFPNHPENKSFGERTISFEKEIYIDEEDFMEVPSKDFYRLYPNNTVRLRYAFCITCKEVVKDTNGKVVELKCEYDHGSKGGVVSEQMGKKVKSTIHWVSAKNAQPAEFRMYDKLFTKPNPENDDDLTNVDLENAINTGNYTMEISNKAKEEEIEKREFEELKNGIEEPIADTENEKGTMGWRKYINKNSLRIYKGLVERSVMECKVGEPIQFERVGFFTKDPDSTEQLPVFNLTVALVDNFAMNKKKDELIKKEKEKMERERIANERKLKKEQKKLKEEQKKKEKQNINGNTENLN